MYHASRPAMRMPRASSSGSVNSRPWNRWAISGGASVWPSAARTAATRYGSLSTCSTISKRLRQRRAGIAYNLPTLMPGYGNAFGRGLILGAGAALLYAAARETLAPARRATAIDYEAEQAIERPRLIDW